MLIAGQELKALINEEVVTPVTQHDGISIDLHLQADVLIEALPTENCPSLADPKHLNAAQFNPFRLSRRGSQFDPGAFLLGATIEEFNMPDNLSAQFSLRSSVARIGIEHANSGWIKPGFQGTLTLELKNFNQGHRIVLYPGMAIGQVTFFRHLGVDDLVYNGKYSGQRYVRRSQ